MSEGGEAYDRYGGATPYRADGTARRAGMYRAGRRGRTDVCPTPRARGAENPFPAHVFRVSASLCRGGPDPEFDLLLNFQLS